MFSLLDVRLYSFSDDTLTDFRVTILLGVTRGEDEGPATGMLVAGKGLFEDGRAGDPLSDHVGERDSSSSWTEDDDFCLSFLRNSAAVVASGEVTLLGEPVGD